MWGEIDLQEVRLLFNAVTFIGLFYAQLLSSQLAWQMVQIYNEISTMCTKNKYKNESVAQAQKYTKAWNNVNFWKLVSTLLFFFLFSSYFFLWSFQSFFQCFSNLFVTKATFLSNSLKTIYVQVYTKIQKWMQICLTGASNLNEMCLRLSATLWP